MSAKTARLVDGTLLSRPRSGRSNRRRWHVVAPLLIAVGLLAMPAFVLSARADHVRPVPGDPAAVVAAYVAAVNDGDLEGILALYADDAVHVALPAAEGSGACLGKEQFRIFYEQGVANGDRLEIEDGTLKIAGDRVTFVARMASDPWRDLGIETLEGNSEAIVKDGRITAHMVMLTPESVRELMTALGTIPALAPGSEQESESGSHELH